MNSSFSCLSAALISPAIELLILRGLLTPSQSLGEDLYLRHVVLVGSREGIRVLHPRFSSSKRYWYPSAGQRVCMHGNFLNFDLLLWPILLVNLNPLHL